MNMNSETAFDYVERCRITAVMRGHFPPEVALKTAQTLIKGGINVLEFTMNSEHAVEAMQIVKSELKDKACVGMGTVLDVKSAERVILKGADFIVSPALNSHVVKIALDADVLVAPGVMTPTEIANAWSMGVKFVKLYPLGPLGVDYLKSIMGPLGHVRIMANGGITPENARLFLRAGAFAVGVTDYLVGDGHMQQSLILERAHIFRQLIEEIDRVTGMLHHV
jgi:2-dehydro-3-deoxyphosphogluconate aldolase / (4S)-4-hydroxy-2-oxoglutarate aldolase